MSDLWVLVCAWYMSSTNKDGEFQNPDRCKCCDGFNKSCEAYCGSYIKTLKYIGGLKENEKYVK